MSGKYTTLILSKNRINKKSKQPRIVNKAGIQEVFGDDFWVIFRSLVFRFSPFPQYRKNFTQRYRERNLVFKIEYRLKN